MRTDTRPFVSFNSKQSYDCLTSFRDENKAGFVRLSQHGAIVSGLIFRDGLTKTRLVWMDTVINKQPQIGFM